MANAMSNPKELVSIVGTKTFAVQNELTVSECEGRNSPLKFYSNFSRFPVAIINEEKKATTGNIKVDDIADIVKRTDFIYNKDMETALIGTPAPTPTSNATENTSLAYTVVLTMGNGLKGKTPAQLLIEDEATNKTRLNSQYEWLKKNLEANPKFRESNQRQMDAIMDASRLLKEGKLNAASVASASSAQSKEFFIYNPGMRPLTRRKRPDGSCFVYEVSVSWTIGNKYPVEVSIVNYYAPVTQNKQGLLNVQASQKKDVIKNTMRMSAADWLHVLYMITTNMRTFENAYANRLYKLAIEANKENREKAGVEQH